MTLTRILPPHLPRAIGWHTAIFLVLEIFVKMKHNSITIRLKTGRCEMEYISVKEAAEGEYRFHYLFKTLLQWRASEHIFGFAYVLLKTVRVMVKLYGIYMEPVKALRLKGLTQI